MPSLCKPLFTCVCKPSLLRTTLLLQLSPANLSIWGKCVLLLVLSLLLEHCVPLVIMLWKTANCYPHPDTSSTSAKAHAFPNYQPVILGGLFLRVYCCLSEGDNETGKDPTRLFLAAWKIPEQQKSILEHHKYKPFLPFPL